MEQSNTRARHRSMQTERSEQRRKRHPVHIEENGYREPSKLAKLAGSINWCRVVLCIAAVYAVVSIGFKAITILSQKNAQKQLMEEQAALEQQVADLEKQREYVGTDEYIEQAAREKFGWVKENEIVFKKKDTAE